MFNVFLSIHLIPLRLRKIQTTYSQCVLRSYIISNTIMSPFELNSNGGSFFTNEQVINGKPTSLSSRSFFCILPLVRWMEETSDSVSCSLGCEHLINLGRSTWIWWYSLQLSAYTDDLLLGCCLLWSPCVVVCDCGFYLSTILK
jgi:hypothetical protein